MQNLKVTLIQAYLFWEDKQKNLHQFELYLNQINQPTDLIILPEMFTTGFSMKAQQLAETMNGNTVDWMKNYAAAKNASIIGGIIVKEKNKYYNRLIYAEPNGKCQTYDKRHLFCMSKEDETYTAGKERLIVDLKGWRICPMICYDLRFPVWCRNQNDYDCMIFIANWPAIRNHAWKNLLIARAMENQSYVIGVNRIGQDGNGIYHSGDTGIINSKGHPVLNKANEACVQTFELSFEELFETRKSLPFLKDADKFHLSK